MSHGSSHPLGGAVVVNELVAAHQYNSPPKYLVPWPRKRCSRFEACASWTQPAVPSPSRLPGRLRRSGRLDACRNFSGHDLYDRKSLAVLDCRVSGSWGAWPARVPTSPQTKRAVRTWGGHEVPNGDLRQNSQENIGRMAHRKELP